MMPCVKPGELNCLFRYVGECRLSYCHAAIDDLEALLKELIAVVKTIRLPQPIPDSGTIAPASEPFQEIPKSTPTMPPPAYQAEPEPEPEPPRRERGRPRKT